MGRNRSQRVVLFLSRRRTRIDLLHGRKTFRERYGSQTTRPARLLLLGVSTETPPSGPPANAQVTRSSNPAPRTGSRLLPDAIVSAPPSGSAGACSRLLQGEACLAACQIRLVVSGPHPRGSEKSATRRELCGKLVGATTCNFVPGIRRPSGNFGATASNEREREPMHRIVWRTAPVALVMFFSDSGFSVWPARAIHRRQILQRQLHALPWRRRQRQHSHRQSAQGQRSSLGRCAEADGRRTQRRHHQGPRQDAGLRRKSFSGHDQVARRLRPHTSQEMKTSL